MFVHGIGIAFFNYRNKYLDSGGYYERIHEDV